MDSSLRRILTMDRPLHKSFRLVLTKSPWDSCYNFSFYAERHQEPGLVTSSQPLTWTANPSLELLLLNLPTDWAHEILIHALVLLTSQEITGVFNPSFSRHDSHIRLQNNSSVYFNLIIISLFFSKFSINAIDYYWLVGLRIKISCSNFLSLNCKEI